jgi:perosamine synthetase
MSNKIQRMGDLESKYVQDVIKMEFSTSNNSHYTKLLEEAFAKKFNAQYSIALMNGTATLHTALAALGVKPGDEVIVPPLTMSSTSLAVLQNGSIPVFADVDPDTFNLDPKSIEKVITKRTKAIMTVALYGLSPDYDAILEICKKRGLYLIEDNAECFLGKYKGKLVGEFGDFSSYSFQASKHLTCGEGGMLICNKESFADAARQFSCLGYAGVSAKQGKITRDSIQDPQYARHVAFGFNFRLSELQSAVALGQLERAEELVEKRLYAAKCFSEAVKGCSFLKPQASPDGYENSYWAYSMVLKTDNPSTDWYRFRDAFKANGGDGYYAAWRLSYQEPYFTDQVQKMKGVWQKYSKPLCPNAEYLQKRMIQLKTNYWDSTEAEKQAEILKKTIQQFK